MNKHSLIEKISIHTQNGMKLAGVIHRPASNKKSKHPVVVILHGLGGNKSGTGDTHVRLAEKLTEHDICCLRFDFRGSGDSDGSLHELSLNDLKEDGYSVIQSLENIPGIDSERVSLFGSSLGGCLSIFVAHQFPKRILNIALWAPVAYGSLWIEEAKKYLDTTKDFCISQTKECVHYQGIPLNKTFEQQFALMNVAEELFLIPKHIGILHLQGKIDRLVSQEQREHFMKMLEKRGVPYESCLYPNFGHSPGNDPDYEQVLDEISLWFKNKLNRS